LFSTSTWAKPTRALKADLKAAGIPHTDDRGFVVDAHALRGTFATLLAKGGTNPRIVQELMRHSDPRLTANLYTTLRLTDTRGALDTLPALTLTGTPSDLVAPPVAPTPGNPGHFGASAGMIERPDVSGGEVGRGAKNPGNVNINRPADNLSHQRAILWQTVPTSCGGRI
jgi:hypothetical protein